MYAVIRSGGKQYRVAPGDLLRLEKLEQTEGTVELHDVLAVRGENGIIARPEGARVTATVVQQGRGDKILVFHYKRKKQYKKLAGHRQPYTEVRIASIHVGGEEFTA